MNPKYKPTLKRNLLKMNIYFNLMIFYPGPDMVKGCVNAMDQIFESICEK